MRRASTAAAMLGLLALGAGAVAAAPALDEAAALRISQAAIGRPLPELRFVDTAGRPVALGDLRGRPLVLNLLYTSCAEACPLVLQNLHPAVEAAQRALGQDSFAVASIGFDARHDTPERLRAYARAQGIDLPNWTFLSADQATVDRLAEATGFVVHPSPQGFDHLAQVTIVDAEGVVYRQVYGAGFAIPAVVEPLKELVFGRRSDWTSVQGLINRIRLFCTLYDPRSERYRFDYSVFVGMVIGALSLAGIAAFLIREWRRAPRAPS